MKSYEKPNYTSSSLCDYHYGDFNVSDQTQKQQCASAEQFVLQAICHTVQSVVEHVWIVMAHVQKPGLVFQRNGRVHLNGRGSQFSLLLAVEGCGSAGRPWIDHVPRHSARVVATLSNCLFPLHFPSHASRVPSRFERPVPSPIIRVERFHDNDR